MRKNNSKALNTSKVSAEREKAKPSLNGRTKAKSGSKTDSIESAGKATRGSNTRKPSALRGDPRLGKLLQRAIDLKNEEQFDEAAEAFAKIVDEYPDCAPANGLLGAILLTKLKRPGDAIPYSRKATELAPESEMASLGLFHALWDTDQVDEAIQEIGRYQRLTNFKCQDYLEIVAEMKKEWVDSPKPKKKAKLKKAHP